MSEAPVLRTALSISGASCQGCAKKIRNALEPLAGSAELVEVNLEAQTVALPEGVDVAEAARIVTETGYPAEAIAAPEAESGSCCASKKATSCCSSKARDEAHEPDEPAAEASTEAGAGADGDAVVLAVTGATCASCVNSIEKALMSVPGVTHAHMNLADNTATASGDVEIGRASCRERG